MIYGIKTSGIKLITIITGILWSLSWPTIAQKVSVIPSPSNVEVLKGQFHFNSALTIQYSAFDEGRTSHYIQEELMSRFNRYGRIEKEKPADIRITLEVLDEKEEAYQLTVGEHIQLTGQKKGLFYAMQTLMQIMETGKGTNKIIIPYIKISDAPRFGWRGLMLDESRHFFGKTVVKQLLKWMAYYKLNVFHWHLTDSPGWRLEIKKYPDLALIGGIGDHHDPLKPAQYYTQQDIREIVRYATSLNITVVPEIDMPGHAAAVNKAYPVFSGGGSEQYPEWTMHPTRDTVVQFLTDVLHEVDALFPAQMIHLGGDEVHFGNDAWNSDPDVQKWMKQNNANNLVEVEHYFINKMADSIRAMNNLVLGWDEIVTAGLPKESSLVFWWRHDKINTLTHALEKDYDVVLCPRIPLYFDFVQLENHQDGRKWGGRFADLEAVFKFPPDSLYNEKYHSQIRGIQANIWTERIANKSRLDYMIYPRLAALGEAAWSKKESKQYQNFMERLKPQMAQYQADNLYYFDVFNPDKTPEPPVLEEN